MTVACRITYQYTSCGRWHLPWHAAVVAFAFAVFFCHHPLYGSTGPGTPTRLRPDPGANSSSGKRSPYDAVVSDMIGLRERSSVILELRHFNGWVGLHGLSWSAMFAWFLVSPSAQKAESSRQKAERRAPVKAPLAG
ncbi:hypothetical protein NUW58_g5084 [Xylaria curta]|uniref:Uncharacterized protein n=1 Tax=Xylaria curta TaxID=42375 RepID=A0ACC1P6D0_9PEZI|nr:hypothetical protein NUW58_g5084 [Xylaria curta]